MSADDRNWPIATLGAHVDLLVGFPFKSKQFTDRPVDIPLVKGSNIHQGYIDWQHAKRWPAGDADGYRKFELRPGDVVVAMDRPWIDAGLKWAWIRPGDPSSLLVQRVARLRGMDGLSTGFVRYLIGGPDFTDYIKPIVTGVTVPHISADQVRSFRFALPPICEQEKIAAVLSAYDDLIENNRRRIGILEAMAQALYREWFVRFRYPGHEKTRLVDSPLGRIPEGWEARKVGDVAEIHRGRSYKSIQLVEDGGVAFLNLKCIDRDGGFRLSGLKRYDGPAKPSQHARPNDIIMAVTDMTQERRIVARAARVPNFGQSDSVLSMDLVKVAPRRDVPTAYVYGMLRFSSFPDEIKQHANGANVLHLNPERIAEFVFPVALESLRNRYAEVADAIYGECDVLGGKNQWLRQSRDLLLPKLISGEVDVSELDIAMEEVA